MNGLLKPEAVAGLPAVAGWLRQSEQVRHRVQAMEENLDGRSLLDASVAQTVLVQLENLRTHPAVAARLAFGDLAIHGWVYHNGNPRGPRIRTAARPIRAHIATQFRRSDRSRRPRPGNSLIIGAREKPTWAPSGDRLERSCQFTDDISLQTS
jgi:hypothetical protein